MGGTRKVSRMGEAGRWWRGYRQDSHLRELSYVHAAVLPPLHQQTHILLFTHSNMEAGHSGAPSERRMKSVVARASPFVGRLVGRVGRMPPADYVGDGGARTSTPYVARGRGVYRGARGRGGHGAPPREMNNIAHPRAPAFPPPELKDDGGGVTLMVTMAGNAGASHERVWVPVEVAATLLRIPVKRIPPLKFDVSMKIDSPPGKPQCFILSANDANDPINVMLFTGERNPFLRFSTPHQTACVVMVWNNYVRQLRVEHTEERPTVIRHSLRAEKHVIEHDAPPQSVRMDKRVRDYSPPPMQRVRARTYPSAPPPEVQRPRSPPRLGHRRKTRFSTNPAPERLMEDGEVVEYPSAPMPVLDPVPAPVRVVVQTRTPSPVVQLRELCRESEELTVNYEDGDTDDEDDALPSSPRRFESTVPNYNEGMRRAVVWGCARMYRACGITYACALQMKTLLIG